ncbi:hypothetical protein LUZ60_007381 [Juncus effusus]|nr:hypothetical protein LUZ60_007381 [Juncus effusus]
MNLAISTKLTEYSHPSFQNPKFNLKQSFGERACANEDQLNIMHMFEKIVTPSDVGKLNRLVIPKQHAERHFPRLEQPSAGMLLCFEDRANGETWHFRYSYWGSSQSYVITKGWSRFVRQKQLSAGDTVSFSSDKRRNCLFISYSHRISTNIVKVSSETIFHRRKAINCNSDLTYSTRKGENLQIGNEIVDFCSDINWCGRRLKKRVRLFGVNLDLFEPTESNCAPLLDLKL